MAARYCKVGLIGFDFVTLVRIDFLLVPEILRFVLVAPSVISSDCMVRRRDSHDISCSSFSRIKFVAFCTSLMIIEAMLCEAFPAN